MSEGASRPKTKTCQVRADEAYWAGIVGALECKPIADVLSPLIRDALRERVAASGIDPDAAWQKVAAAGHRKGSQ